jgi:DNA polymerase III delta prime subunit
MIPYLISGPPGTGKTKTMVESALQILRNDPKAKILLSAPSNAAADTLVRRLKAHLLPQQMFRLNSDKRTFAEVPQTILPYCFVENDKFGLPPIKDLMKFRIVVTTCSDAAIITKARVTNYHIQIAREHFEQHLYFHPERLTASLFWTHLLIDEAAQASEPETLAAIEVVLPAFPDVRPTLVLCGDRHQCKSFIAISWYMLTGSGSRYCFSTGSKGRPRYLFTRTVILHRRLPRYQDSPRLQQNRLLLLPCRELPIYACYPDGPIWTLLR